MVSPRLSFVTLGVSDIARSRDFYERVVGWTALSQSNDHVVFFQLNGVVLACFGARALTEDAGVAPRAPGGAVALAYNVAERDDVDVLIAELEGRGALVTRAASDAFWGGRTAYFADPDGYMWEIAWNPGGYLDEHGNFFVR